MSKQLAFPKSKMKILLLEGVHPSAADVFKQAGYSVELSKNAMTEDELLEVIDSVHVLGIRSKTNVTEKVIDKAHKLLTIGCFCIGTNQVALDAACSHGIPVFNAPISNTRSVAELTMAEIVMLSRKAAQRSAEVHQGIWKKSAAGCNEVKGKSIGIIGYGNIGPQVGLLAEAFGMKVKFYDILKKLPLGTAQPAASLQEILKESDFVTLHVPETAETKNMISKKEISMMKEGSYLLNLSRGTVVDLDALREALDSGHIRGAAVDVYPKEPKTNDEPFETVLQGAPNTILTPHIGGSTSEAQNNIGIEVATAIINLTDRGSTGGAVNFPEIDLPVLTESHRVLNIHRNVPGVLSQINSIVAETGANIKSQFLGTKDDVGYLIMDVSPELSRAVKHDLDALDANIKTRLLF